MTLDAGARRGAPMSDVGSTGTRGGSALSVGTTIRHVSVHGQRVRVAVRPGSGAGTPLVLCCGLGAGLEVFQPVIDALPAEVEVIRFDVPGVGGSPTGPLHYRFGLLALGLTRGVGRAWVRPGRCARILLGRRSGAAIRRTIPAALSPAGTGEHGHRNGDGSRPAEHADQDDGSAPVP